MMTAFSFLGEYFLLHYSQPALYEQNIARVPEREIMPRSIISCQLNAHTVWAAFVLVVVKIPDWALRSVSLLFQPQNLPLLLWESGQNLCWVTATSADGLISTWPPPERATVTKYKHLFQLTRALSVRWEQLQQHNAICEASAYINY